MLGLVAHLAFWVLLIVGFTERSRWTTAVFLVLWVVGYVGADWVRGGGFIFQSWVAVLDIVLFFQLRKSGVHIR